MELFRHLLSRGRRHRSRSASDCILGLDIEHHLLSTITRDGSEVATEENHYIAFGQIIGQAMELTKQLIVD